MFCRPVGAYRRAREKGVADEATEDADNPHDGQERSDTMNPKPEGTATMLSIGEATILVEAEMHELGTLLFRRKKQREKQRR